MRLGGFLLRFRAFVMNRNLEPIRQNCIGSLGGSDL